ncbi:MAG: glycosyltransferase family 9 protein, partial [Flavobacteriales bacterium]
MSIMYNYSIQLYKLYKTFNFTNFQLYRQASIMPNNYQKILVIQTAFIGDAILATGVIEKLNESFPDAEIDILVRKGNESLFEKHPFLNRILIWQKD